MKKILSLVAAAFFLAAPALADYAFESGYQGDSAVVKLTNCSSVKQEGRLCWDTDNDLLYIGTGTAAVASPSGSVSIADAAGDTTTFPMLATAATGSLTPATDAGLAYNATTNALELGGTTGAALSAAAGVLTMGGIGNSLNENLTFNFEAYANFVQLNSTTGALLAMQIALTMFDDLSVNFGNGSDATLQFDAAEGNDTLKLGMRLPGDATASGNFMLVEAADINSNFGVGVVSNPTFRIQSADATTTDDYIQFYHDGTDAKIDVGDGSGTGRLIISGTGGTNNEGFSIDNESVVDRHIFGSLTGAQFRFDSTTGFQSTVTIVDNVPYRIGSGGDVDLEWDTAEGNDALKLAIGVGSAAQSGNVGIVEYADKDVNFGWAANTDPHLILQSSDAATVTDNVQVFHDQTNGNITTGGGNLNIAPAGGTTAHTGAVTATTDITSSDTGSVGWTAVAGVNTACNTTCTSGCGFGIDILVGVVSCDNAAADTCLCLGAS